MNPQPPPLLSISMSMSNSISATPTPSQSVISDIVEEVISLENIYTMVGGLTGGLITAFGIIFSFIHRKKIRKQCCGKTFTVTIENTDEVDEKEKDKETDTVVEPTPNKN